MISSSERNPIVKDSVFVFYGNNDQGPISIDEKEISYFNFEVLKQNFKAFIDELTSNDLKASSWDDLLGFDPKAEANDQPNKDSNPCPDDMTLADAQKIAQDYVNCKMTGKV